MRYRATVRPGGAAGRRRPDARAVRDTIPPLICIPITLKLRSRAADRSVAWCTMKTPYDVLGVAPDADDKTIDIAFRRAAKTCHPDNNLNNGAAERQFKLVLAARDTLKNPEWRALYRYLQFRRQHERRHWTITILSCVVSAVVSGGLVAVLQPSASESVTGEPAALAGPATHEIATLQEHFEIVGLSQEPAASGLK